MTLRAIIGAFRLTRRRASELGVPGVAVWSDAGEAAAVGLGARVAKLAHADEVADLEAAKEIDAGMAGLADGHASAADLAHFERAARLTRKSAELAHDLGDSVS